MKASRCSRATRSRRSRRTIRRRRPRRRRARRRRPRRRWRSLPRTPRCYFETPSGLCSRACARAGVGTVSPSRRVQTASDSPRRTSSPRRRSVSSAGSGRRAWPPSHRALRRVPCPDSRVRGEGERHVSGDDDGRRTEGRSGTPALAANDLKKTRLFSSARRDRSGRRTSSRDDPLFGAVITAYRSRGAMFETRETPVALSRVVQETRTRTNRCTQSAGDAARDSRPRPRH